jgi:protein-S-isoprenylcysteine O-methyltransferase Ste14
VSHPWVPLGRRSRSLLAVAVAWLSFYTKARREESFLTQEFGDRFAEHRRHTGMFLPHFL